MRSRIGTLSLALLLAACSAGDPIAATVTSTPAPGTTSTSTTEVTTSSTLASVATGEPDPVITPAGVWLAVPSPAVYLQFDLDVGAGEVLGTFDSLGEGVEGLAVSGTWDGSRLDLEIPELDASFSGEIIDEGWTLSGTMDLPGMRMPVRFERRAEPFAFVRPQTPVPPFPYETEEVSFRSESAEIDLAGTLIRPTGTGPFPAVVFVSGSGPQDRDETMLGHRPFAVLADAFARNGIASLRYDDRGVGESGGTFAGALPDDLAADAAAAVEFLAGEIGTSWVGIVGHSEGGIVGPMASLQSDRVSFLILLAGPGVPGAEILIRQTTDILAAEGLPQDAIAGRLEWMEPAIRVAAGGGTDAEVTAAIEEALASIDSAVAAIPGVVDPPEAVAAALLDPWMRAFLRLDPGPYLESVEVPVLALVGSLDVQVSAETNAPALEAALAGNPDAVVRVLPGLNHLFQDATTGGLSEYAMLTETFDRDTIDLIVGWILERFGEARDPQTALIPPSTASTCPVVYDEASDSRKMDAPAISSGRAWRPSAVRSVK